VEDEELKFKELKIQHNNKEIKGVLTINISSIQLVEREAKKCHLRDSRNPLGQKKNNESNIRFGNRGIFEAIIGTY
jgi:hypothetical protein